MRRSLYLGMQVFKSTLFPQSRAGAVSIRISIVEFSLLTLLGTGCSFGMREESTPSQAPLTPLPSAAETVVITATMAATSTPRLSETPFVPPPKPTAVPVEGMTSTQVNVRAEPSTASNVLGMIPESTKVEITGKDPGGNWWQINYPQGVDGKGWITAQYVTTASTPEVPTIGGNETESNNGNVAIIQQQLNVRSGPGTDFNSLGTLNPQDVVNLTGKDSNGAWLQIDFATGPDGKGWVNAAFVQATGAENLPIITETGLIIGTGTPTSIPFTPTATLLPARADGDSAEAPAANVTFSSIGIRDLQYSSDISSPSGDAEDWLQFTPYGDHILLDVSCKGSNVHIEFFQREEVIFQVTTQNCASRQIVSAQPGEPVQVHVGTIPNESLNYSFYSLNIRSLP